MSKKGENIYKRKDNRWEARYIKAYAPDGSAKYGYCYGKTYHEAKEKVTKAKSELLISSARGTCSPKKAFEYYCDEWLYMKQSHIKESTYDKYNNIIEKHIKPFWGGFLIQSVNSVTVEKFSQKLLSDAKLSAKTVKDVLTVLHSILMYAAKQAANAMPIIEITYPKERKKEMRVLSREEQSQFVDFLLQDMNAYKFGILLALLTGMRIGEICALKWENVSLEKQQISVIHTMQRIKNSDDDKKEKTKIIISEPKTDHSVRIIPLTEAGIKLCSLHKCSDPSSFVLTGSPTEYIEPRNMQYRIKKYAAECGLTDVHFHTLRHTFATRCIEVDFEIKSLSEILGHSSPRITLERYVHSSMELKRSNMNKLKVIGY
jgi:integrase